VGLSVAETAAVMGCAEGTVKSTLADARARLRTLLGVDE
jgi:DNA-directed RNA polymerase specialized sigma24 family protein